MTMSEAEAMMEEVVDEFTLVEVGGDTDRWDAERRDTERWDTQISDRFTTN